MRPMLAETLPDVNNAKVPLVASAKLDGIRCLNRLKTPLSRSLKVIPNRFIQACLGDQPLLEGLDGELTVGSPTAHDVYRVTNSAVMSHSGEPEFTWRIFDKFDAEAGFLSRLTEAKVAVDRWNDKFGGRLHFSVEMHPHSVIKTVENLIEYEEACLSIGYEGLILRDINGPYKHGRSTLKEGWMLKLKRFVDSEANIIGFEELMHNDNAAFTNELGQTARSTLEQNLRESGMLGALIVESSEYPKSFKIGTGFDMGLRKLLWDNRHSYLGKQVKYKHFPIGVKDVPRHPVFLGFRHEDDAS